MKKAVVIILVIAVIGAVVYFVFFNKGFGLGKGSGSGDGSGAVSAAESQSAPEESVSEPEVEEMKYLNVTVTDNDYLYQNDKIGLDELVKKLIADAAETSVKVTDNNASRKAYNSLIDELKKNNIRYIED